MSEKTEKPTEKKKKDSREKGQVGQSQELPKFFILIAVLEVFIALVEMGMEKLSAGILFAINVMNVPFDKAIEMVAKNTLVFFAVLTGIILVTAIAARLVGTWLQIGFLFAPKALTDNALGKINPISNFKNMFSMEKLLELVMNIIKAILIGIIFTYVTLFYFQDMLYLPRVTLAEMWRTFSDIFIFIVRLCAALLLALAVADVLLKKYFSEKKIKMSKDEVIREYKEMFGSPEMKSERKNFFMELMNSPPPQPKIKDADMVVVNPTHFAIALSYKPDEHPLPVIIYNRADNEARDVIKEAREEKLPVVRFVWLARTLARMTEEGDNIPRETMKAVVIVYKLVELINNELPPDEVSEWYNSEGIIEFPDELYDDGNKAETDEVQDELLSNELDVELDDKLDESSNDELNERLGESLNQFLDNSPFSGLNKGPDNDDDPEEVHPKQ
ncbi:EscU/YscU/HrcU family type III secretion system export apparatus switch protein [Veronia pacifica]|uniref:EscU/YscU/HrcU family type III secretion system export apparatus switch protein n=1 Tax=Veronia pacifica TaxID=1080227 RepID=A0A1C3ER04_9GAMM|nr:EscU/YscU/HrcU family type III secretion system export apparatus switch protein [Veronia pacifica]ODA35674.1 hypothetical protein A8L45_03405 [Veronia pacifica]